MEFSDPVIVRHVKRMTKRAAIRLGTLAILVGVSEASAQSTSGGYRVPHPLSHPIEFPQSHPLEFPNACNVPTASTGHSFYVDPSAGSVNNNGSANAPWSTLSAVITAGLFTNNTIKAGDTVYLRSGNHGSITLNGQNADFITIAADAGATPVITSVNITGSKWIVKGLTI